MTANNSPVLTSKSSHIGGHRIIREIGLIKTDKTTFIGGAYDSFAEGLDDLKQVARSKGANGIINIEVEKSGWSGKPTMVSGLAVIIESSSR